MQKDIRDLVRDAFLQARRRGKPDWREMTIAVLKNRLIQLAGGEFNEQAYGSDSLRALVLKLNDLVRLDTSTYPATVELIDAKSVATIEATQNQAPARDRIRPDLWRAFVDFASGKTYVWDPMDHIAREVRPGETLKPLPTITATELAAWREEFAVHHRDQLQEREKIELELWQEKGLGTTYLPAQLRSLWNQELQRKIEERLRDWFAAEGVELPKRVEVSRHRGRGDDSIEALRSLIMECIQAMTREELEELRLPPRALLRAKGK